MQASLSLSQAHAHTRAHTYTHTLLAQSKEGGAIPTSVSIVGDTSGDSSDGEGAGDRSSRDLTRKAVEALLKLAEGGKIADTEKRLLLADVIRCTCLSTGEPI